MGGEYLAPARARGKEGVGGGEFDTGRALKLTELVYH